MLCITYICHFKWGICGWWQCAEHIWMSIMHSNSMVNSQWTCGHAVLITVTLESFDLWSLKSAAWSHVWKKRSPICFLPFSWTCGHESAQQKAHLKSICCYVTYVGVVLFLPSPSLLWQARHSRMFVLIVNVAFFPQPWFWQRGWSSMLRPPVSSPGERGVEAAPEPDYDGELRPAGEGRHNVGCGQATAGRRC